MKKIIPIIYLLLFFSLLTAGTNIVNSQETDQSEELFFTIMHTNDEHSALLPRPYVDYHPDRPDTTVGGFARISTVAGQIRNAKSTIGEETIMISAGDYIGGAPYCWLIPGGESPELSVMRAIGYDILTIGNHEFDYGSEILAQYYRRAGYPATNRTMALLSSNLDIPIEHPLAGVGSKNVHILELNNGLRLGFFGLLGDAASGLAAKKYPIEIINTVKAARESVEKLQEMEADVIIAVTHSGLYEDRRLAKKVPEIDIIVAGHCHTPLYKPMFVDDTILVQSGVRLSYLGVLELAYNTNDGALRIRNEDNEIPFLIPIDDSIEEDPVVARIIDDYTKKLNNLVRRLTNNMVRNIDDFILYSEFELEAGPPLKESIFGNFLTDGMRLMVEEITGEKVDFAIQANGVIRQSVYPGTMKDSLNKINFYDFVSTIGLGAGKTGSPGYPLTSFYLTGNEIYRVLELTSILSRVYGDTFFLQLSGGRYTYDPSRAVLFKIPFTKIPIPSFRAVSKVEIYNGTGLQTTEDGKYETIARNDDSLYHVVCDSYVLAFIPIVKDMVPFYSVVPKDIDGNELKPEKAVIKINGEELSFWQAAVGYALAQEPGPDKIPVLPDYYKNTGDRITETKLFPVILWVLIGIAGAIVAFFVLRIIFRLIKKLTGKIKEKRIARKEAKMAAKQQLAQK